MAKDRFNGSDYVPAEDDVRLTSQLLAIWQLMRDGVRRTVQEIAKATGFPENSIAAQLRHLRKPRFGGHTVTRYWRDKQTKLSEYAVTTIGNEALVR